MLALLSPPLVWTSCLILGIQLDLLLQSDIYPGIPQHSPWALKICVIKFYSFLFTIPWVLTKVESHIYPSQERKQFLTPRKVPVLFPCSKQFPFSCCLEIMSVLIMLSYTDSFSFLVSIIHSIQLRVKDFIISLKMNFAYFLGPFIAFGEFQRVQ